MIHLWVVKPNKKGMTARIRDNQFKGVLIILLFIILSLKVLVAQGQTAGTYKGFVASFGTRSIKVSSNIEKINQTNLMETGGSVGLIYGNNIIRTKLGVFGYYGSAGSVSGTTALYTSHLSLNFYPLQIFAARQFTLEPYISGWMSYDRYKFFGYYLNQEPGQTNYSQAEAPYLGKIKQVNANIGLGLELRLKDDYDFIQFFTEVKYGHNLSEKASVAFEQTSLKNQLHTVIGIAFGAIR